MIPIIDKSQFLKAISVIDKLSPINFSDKCCEKTFDAFDEVFFCKSYCGNVFLDFSRRESSSRTLPWHYTKQREIF